MKKRIMSIVIMVFFLLFAIDNAVVTSKAEIEDNNNSESKELQTIIINKDKKIVTNFDIKDENEYTKKIIDDEKSKNTGLIDKKVEIALNEAGILDEEIRNFTDEDINNIEDAKEITIKTEYYEYDDVLGEFHEMQNDKIEEYYQEKCIDSEKNVKMKEG